MIVSNNEAVEDTLVALGPRGAAVTCSVAAPAPAAAAPPVPQGAPWVHLTLEFTEAPVAPVADRPAASSPPPDASTGTPHTRGRTQRMVPAGAHTRLKPAAAAAEMREILQQPQPALCAVLRSSLERASGEQFEALRRRLLQARDSLGGDFPYEILTRKSLQRALMAGFGEKSTWFACEKTAVLDAIVKFPPPGMLAQVGLLALVRSDLDTARHAPSRGLPVLGPHTTHAGRQTLLLGHRAPCAVAWSPCCCLLHHTCMVTGAAHVHRTHAAHHGSRHPGTVED